MKIKLLLFLAFSFCVNYSFSAEKDSIKTNTPSTYNYSKAPSIGYNIGYLNFFGDVKLNGYKPSFGSRLGHQFYISIPLSKSFNISYNFFAGKIFGEETRSADNLNFRTSLVGQALMVEYNFYAIIKPEEDSKLSLLPFIGFGVEALVFRAKADMKNASEKKYYYWDDGSIKDMPQTSGNIDLAVNIERDNTYETELRDANLDGFGKYSQITFAMPFTFGADLKVGKNLNFRLGATYHYTFSDMLDNVSSVGSGNRKGAAGKDMFLFSSLGVSYKFGAPKKEKGVDTDEDGIADILDKCRETPKGVKVDKNGCPQVNDKDRDGDGVLDVVDKCRDTKAGDKVDKEGCSEEQKDNLVKIAQQADSIAAAKAVKDAEIKSVNDGFYFADLNKNGKVEVSEVNEFIDRLFDNDKNVTVPLMEEIIDYYFSQDDKGNDVKELDKKVEEKIAGKMDTIKTTNALPEIETKPIEIKGTLDVETKPVEAKGIQEAEKKPVEQKALEPKYYFADLNKNGKIDKEELDIFINRMNKGDKSVPIKLIDEILEKYFKQD